MLDNQHVFLSNLIRLEVLNLKDQNLLNDEGVGKLKSKRIENKYLRGKRGNWESERDEERRVSEGCGGCWWRRRRRKNKIWWRS